MLDTTAPSGGTPVLTAAADSGTSHTDGITDVTAPTFTVALNPTVAAGDTVQLLLGGSALAHPVTHTITPADVTAGSITLTVTAGDLGADGTKSITAQFSDAAGNSSTTSADVITIDTTAPQVAIGNPGGPTNQPSLSLSGTIAGADAGTTIAIFDGATQIGVATISGSTWSANVTLSNGSNLLTAQVTDLAGNTATSSAVTYTLNTTAPTGGTPVLTAASDSGTSHTDGITDVTAPTFTVALGSTVVAGDTVQLLLGGSALAHPVTHIITPADVTAGSITLTVTAGDLGADGSKQISAQFSDGFGNSSTTSALIITLDTTAPSGGTPVLTAAANSGTSHTDGITDVTAPTFTVALNPTVAAGDTVQLLLGGSALAHPVTHTITPADVTAGSITLTVTAGDLGADGTKSITAQFSDAAGNSSTTSADVITIDTTAPQVAIGNPGGPTNQPSLSLSGTIAGADAGTTIAIFDGATQIGVATISGSTWSANVTLSNGSNLLTAQVTDLAGNTATSSAVTYTLNTTAPTGGTPVLTAASDSGTSHTDGITDVTAPTFTVALGSTVVAGDTVQLLLGGSALAHPVTHIITPADVTAGSITLTVTAGDLGADGSKQISAQFSDGFGNSSTTSALIITLDTTAPTVTTLTDVTSNGADLDAGQTVTFTLTASEALTIANGAALTLSNGATAVYNSSSGKFVYTVAAGQDIADLKVTGYSGTITDAAGNALAASGVTLDTLVKIDTVAPTGGTPALTAASDSGSSSTDNITDVTSPTFTVALNPTVAVGDTVQLLLNGSQLAHPVVHSVTADDIGAGSVSLTVTAGDLGADGSKSITATFTDVAGNTSTTSADVITLDTTAPIVTIGNAGGNTNQSAQTISGTVDLGDVGAMVKIYDNGGTTPVTTALVLSDGTWSKTVTLVSGTNSLTAQVTDAAGNTGTSNTVIFTLNTVGPTITMGVVGQNDVVNVTQTTSGVTISGMETNADGQTVTVTVLNTGKQVVDTLTTVASAGAWSATLSEAQLLALPSGVYTFQASVSDQFGTVASPANQIVTVTRSLEWVATSGGDWAQGSNWSGAVAPTAVDNATIDRTGSYSITVSSADNVSSLLVTDPGTAISINANASLAVAGVLTLNAGLLKLSGTISGGTIVSGGGTIVWNSGILSGVTYDGTMDLSPNSSSVYITNGLTVTGVSGTGAGSINLTGTSDNIYFEGTQTFDNATINLGNATGYSDTVYQYDINNTGSVLTLGPHLTVNVNTNNYVYLGSAGSNHAGDGIVNQGTINVQGTASGYLDVDPYNFTNQGIINVSNGHSLYLQPSTSLSNAAGGVINIGTGSTLYFGITSGTSSNAGTITASGATVYFYSFGNFTNTGTLNVTNSSVYLYGSYTTAQVAQFANEGDTIYIYGTLTNTGTTLNVGPGTGLSSVTLAGSGTIVGGTIVDQGSGLKFQSGILSGVTYDGTMDLSPNSSSVYITNGLTVTGVNGTGAGSINLTGTSDNIYFEGTQTFDNATINLGNATGYSDTVYQYDINNTGSVLTLGPHLTVNVNTNNYVYLGSAGSNHAGDGIVNQGTINVQGTASGYLDVDPYNFTNQGIINVSNGHSLYLQPSTSLSNAAGGVINIGTGSTLYFGITSGTSSNAGTITASGATVYFYSFGNFTNTGTLNVTNSSVYLYGSYTTAQVAQFANEGDTIYIYGTLTNTGTTLNVGPGTGLSSVTLTGSGTIVGGTIVDQGSGLKFQSGILSGVTYDGTMDLSPNSSSVYITNGLTVTGVSGTGAGSINLTGTSDNIYFEGTQTFDNATINLGNATGYSDTVYQYDINNTGSVLTLGPHLTVNVNTNNYVYLGSAGSNHAGDGIVNQGTINVQGTASGYLDVDPYNFTNQGIINVSNGHSLYLQPSTSLSNAAGGVINIGTGSTLYFGITSGTSSNAGTITASGATVYFYSFGNFTNTGTLNVTNSSVYLYGSYTTAQVAQFANEGDTIYIYGTLTNTGTTLNVGPGTGLSSVTLAGSGTIVGGTIVDQGSGLKFQSGILSGVTYDGTMDLSPNSSSVYITNGLTVTGVNGTGAGSINLTGTSDNIYFEGTQTFDNATINLGNATGYSDTVYQYDINNTGSVLTLGPHLTVNVNTNNYVYLGSAGSNHAGDGIVNQGTINVQGTASGYLDVDPYNFTNQGIINVSNGHSLYLQPSTSLSNAAGGVISVSGAGSVIYFGSNGQTWTNAGTITASSGGALHLYGNYTTAQLNSITENGGTIYIDGTLTNTGTTLNVGPGTSLASLVLESGGTIVGGTIVDQGSGLKFQSGILSGVTYDGTMDLSPNSSSVYITNGLTVTGVNGTGAGSINLTGTSDNIYFEGTQTFDNATINLGNATGYSDTVYQYDINNTGSVLTLGPHLTVNVNTNNYVYLGSAGSNHAGDGIVNQGTINVQGTASGYLDVDPYNFTNQGIINVSNGHSLYLQPSTSLSNAAGGVISVSGAGSVIYFGSNGQTWTNAGTITASSGGALHLYGNYTTAQLNSITENGGTIYIDGTLTNTGTTLNVGPGTSLASLVLESGGTIVGGTIVDQGSGLKFQSGILSGVTYDGTMDLSPNSSSVYITNGLTVTGVNGTGAGSINLTGTSDNIYFEGTQTFDNATINLGNATGYSDTVYQYDINNTGSVLTLGPHLTVNVNTNNYVYLGSAGSNHAGDGIVNQGTINVQGTASGYLDVDPYNFTNQGIINVSNGHSLYLQPSTSLSNAAGGVISVSGAGSVIYFGGNGQTWTNAGTITASSGGALHLYGNYTTAQLNSITENGGTIYIDGTLTNTGTTLNVGPGTSLASLVLESGGTIVGGTIVDQGSGLKFQSGTLSGVTYDGTMGLSPNSSNVVVTSGLTLAGVNGTGLGTVNLTGTSGSLYMEGGETLNNATFNIGNSGNYDYLYNYDSAGVATVTLGANLTINHVGTYASFNTSEYGRSGSGIVNAGTINASLSGGTFTVAGGGSFTNQGAINVSNGDTLNISAGFNNRGIVNVQSGRLSLSGGGRLSGTFNISAGATAQFNGSTPFILTGIAAFIGGAISGNGSFNIGNGARVEISSSDTGSIGTVPTVAFSSGNSTLILDNPSTFQSPISGLAIGDTIDFVNTVVTSASINGSTLTVGTSGQSLTYQISGALAGNSFAVLSSAVAGSQIILVPGAPGAGTQITGNINAGTLFFAPTSTQLYQLVGANISGAGGPGFSLNSTDSTPTDNLFVEISSASSISVSGTGFDGVRVTTAGASAFVFNAAPISSAQQGINVVSQGSGNITINSSGNIIAGSTGIGADDTATTILASANSFISISTFGSINAGTTAMSNGHVPEGIWAGYGNSTSPLPNANGTLIINNGANITAPADDAIDAFNFANGNVTVNDLSGTTISGGVNGIAAFAESGGTGNITIDVSSGATIKAASNNGILALSKSTGSISITTAPGDTITGDAGSTGSSGIDAVNELAAIPLTAASSIVVTAYGTINSGSAVTGTGTPPAGILAGYLGGSASPATFPLTAINGDVVVNNFANITAAGGDGIRAYNYGIGDVTVSDEAGEIVALGGANPTNGYGVGIGAYDFGTGNIDVSTAAGTSIQSGSSGISAINEAPAAPSNSTVIVVAHGTITSGIIPTGGGSPAAGILAGYNFNSSADGNVAGSLIIDDFASISAPSGTDGVRGINYGVGDITITAEASAVITGGRYGIAGVGHDGGDVQINNSAMVQGTTAAIFAQTTSAGTVTILNSSTGVIENSGSSSNPAISIADDATGSAVINNFGTIEANQNSAAALAILETGSSITINNSSDIIGDVNVSNAIFNNNVGADWEFAGTNTFASGINVINNAGIINGQGSAGTIQITSGSLDIVGAINGTVNLNIGSGATLELNGPGSTGETVTFLGTQGTLVLNHSLTSPFAGQISNLTGTALIHDNVDLSDLAWNGMGSANYVATTAASGILTVNDGSGHAEVFNLVNYTGTGIFTAQDDGHGGTLVFDPPATTPLPELHTVSSELESSSAGVTPIPNTHPTVEPLGGFDLEDGRSKSSLIDSTVRANASDEGWHFKTEQAHPTPFPQASMQPHDHTLSIGRNDNANAEGVAGMRFGAGGDTMAFKPELDRNAFPGHFDEKIGLEWSAFAKFADVHAIAQAVTNGTNAFAGTEHSDSAPPSSALPHADHFVFFHL